MEQYRPGQLAPRSGRIACKQYKGTQKHVTAGTRFPICENWDQHDGRACAWEYVDAR